jgi:hypothetical protein
MILDLMFWNGDKDQANKLARLIADIEPAKRTDVIFLFSARYDTDHDAATVQYVKNKFPVETFKSTHMAAGWPDGPNKLMGDSYMHCVKIARQRNIPIEDEFVLFIEPDVVPLKNDWLDRIMKEYRGCGKKILGSWIGKTNSCQAHVNGNMCMRLDFWRTCDEIFHPRKRAAWDTNLWPYIQPHAAPSREIWNDWRLGLGDNPWRGVDFLWEPKSFQDEGNPLYGEVLSPSMFHGCKRTEGLDEARARLVDKKV